MTALTEETGTFELIQRVQNGQKDQFGRIYARFYKTIKTFVLRRLTDPWSADDITQEVFTRALKNIDRYQFQGSEITAWLYTIARNLIADHHKAAWNSRVTAQEEIAFHGYIDPSPEGTPDKLVLAHLDQKALIEAMKLLNPRHQQCIIFRYFEELTVAETAALLGIAPQATKALTYRAIRALFHAYQEVTRNDDDASS